MNSIRLISPYKYNGMWVFDDPTVGLLREAFVAGADVMIDRLVADVGINDAGKGFNMLFSHTPFPGYTVMLEWVRVDEQYGGNIYNCEKYNLSCWLCPALYKYFPVAPPLIYVGAFVVR